MLGCKIITVFMRDSSKMANLMAMVEGSTSMGRVMRVSGERVLGSAKSLSLKRLGGWRLPRASVALRRLVLETRPSALRILCTQSLLEPREAKDLIP